MKSVHYLKTSTKKYCLEYCSTPVPKIKSNEILVRIRCSSLNINDYERYKPQKTILARLINLFQGRESQPLGGEFSGIVESVGVDVTNFKKGDFIMGMSEGVFPYGCWAEYAVCKSDRVVKKPSYLSFYEAGVVSLSGVAAISGLLVCDIKQNDSLLIIGASGGVGLLTLQLAKALGCRITAICSSRNIPLAYKYGADRVFDYNSIEGLSSVGVFDKIIGINGNYKLKDIANCLKVGGVYTVVGNVKQLFSTIPWLLLSKVIRKDFRISSVALSRCERELSELIRVMSDSYIIPYIDKIYTLENIEEALDYILKNHAQGKVAISVN